MEGILIKVKNGWVLTVNDIIYATTENAPYARLSAKNCQEIEQQKESNDEVFPVLNVKVELEQDYSNRSCNNCCFDTDGKCDINKTKCVSKTNDDNHKDWWASKLDEEEDSEIYKPCLDENGCIILKLKSE